MTGWLHITLVVAFAGISLLLFFFIQHLFCHPKPPQTAVPRVPSFHHHANESITDNKTRTTRSSKPLFNWSDNPSLITDAIENGWSRFAFTDYVSSTSSSVKSNRFLLSSCAGVDGKDDFDELEISWEVCHGSADFMQKIRLNPGLKTSSISVIRSALPLPGPALGNSSPFPQEAYFEITIVSSYEKENGMKGRANMGEGENIKLIQENGGNVKGLHVNYEEMRGRSCTKDIVEEKNDVNIMMSVGLTGGGLLPVKLPGSYPGSIGFNSDGSIYLDGVKHLSELDIKRWEQLEKVIGCGYNPSEKKVFFTIDSKRVHEIQCTAEDFRTPLYPTVAANCDVTILVNFGQSIFKYAPANAQRTQNPCFIGSTENSSSLGYEDSKELFSMGILDSQWLNRSTTRSGQYNENLNKGKTKDYDEASEGDLFEIVIDSNIYRKSPNNPFN